MNVPTLLAAALTSVAAVALASVLFRNQPATRRLFLILLLTMIVVVPVLACLLDLRLTIGLPAAEWARLETAHLDLAWNVLLFIGGPFALHHIFEVTRSRRQIGRLPLIDQDDRLDRMVDQLSVALDSGRRPEFRRGVQAGATTLGRRTVVLPEGWQHWSTDTLRAVLAHEFVHLRRRDDLWINFAWLVVAVYWWLPWLRMLPGLLERSVEESCDDLASFLVQSDAAYLEGLYEVARRSAASNGFPVNGLPVNELPVNVAVRATGSSLQARFRRFALFRDQQIDSRGLYWSGFSALGLIVLIWSLQIGTVDPGLDPRLRVVGTALDDGQSFSVRLRVAPQPSPGADAIRRSGGTAGADPPSD